MSAPKILTVGLRTPIHTLDPRRPTVEAMQVMRQLLEPPFDYDPSTGEIEPVLFTGPLEPVPGRAHPTYRGRLHPGLYFSDGAPVTASRLSTSLRAAPFVRQWAEVSAEGDDVIFALTRANGRFVVALTHVQCYLHRRVDGEIVGSGPFALASGGTPVERRLVRNSYFRRPVALDEIRFKAYPDDDRGGATPLVDAINRGEVDLTTVLPRDDVNRVKGVRKVVLPGFSTALLFFNVQSPALADPQVRLALAHGIDRTAFAADAYENALAFTAASLLPRAMAAASDGLEFDPRRACALLARPGLKPTSPLKLVLTWASRPYLPNPARAADLLGRQLAALGIAVDVIKTATTDEYYRRIIEGAYDLVLAGYTADTLDPCDFLESCLASDRVPTEANVSMSVNNARLRSRAMDEAIAAYRAERTAAGLEAVMERLREEVPLVPLMHGSMCTVSSYRVANLKASPLTWMDLSNLDLTG